MTVYVSLVEHCPCRIVTVEGSTDQTRRGLLVTGFLFTGSPTPASATASVEADGSYTLQFTIMGRPDPRSFGGSPVKYGDVILFGNGTTIPTITEPIRP